MNDIDYSKYPLQSLYEARSNVNREQYPRNAQMIDHWIKARESEVPYSEPQPAEKKKSDSATTASEIEPPIIKMESAKGGSLGEGVFYSQDDYAGLGRRAAILILDSLVVIAMILVIGLSCDFLVNESSAFWVYLPAVMLFVSWLYLAIIKRSNMGTLGYFVTNCRIVDLTGSRPSILTMTYRFLLLIFGPLHFFYDFLWLCNDQNKQTLRDKLAKTYVVNRVAQPEGIGQKTLVPIFFFLFSYQFTEVQRPKIS